MKIYHWILSRVFLFLASSSRKNYDKWEYWLSKAAIEVDKSK